MTESNNFPGWHATTILCVKKDGKTFIAGDGQVSVGDTVMKATANKLRTMNDGKIVTGFAGATADALTLFERLEAKLELHPNQLQRACVELAKDWRTDRYLRRLEAMMIVADKDHVMVLTGNGDVLQPEDDIAAIGSGGNFALSAAKALKDVKGLSAEDIVRKSMAVAADICVYTNGNLNVHEIK